MKSKTLFLACFAILAGLPNTVVGGPTSDPTLVFLRPKESLLWCTATNSTVADYVLITARKRKGQYLPLFLTYHVLRPFLWRDLSVIWSVRHLHA